MVNEIDPSQGHGQSVHCDLSHTHTHSDTHTHRAAIGCCFKVPGPEIHDMLACLSSVTCASGTSGGGEHEQISPV